MALLSLKTKKPSSVSEIMASFSDTINQLRNLESEKSEESLEELRAAEIAKSRAQFAKAEADKARAIANSLSALIGEKTTEETKEAA